MGGLGHADLELRYDALHVLSKLKIEAADLLFAKGSSSQSAVSGLQNLYDRGNLRLVLVDHNLYLGK